jgi:hypothetical protein
MSQKTKNRINTENNYASRQKKKAKRLRIISVTIAGFALVGIVASVIAPVIV